MDAAEVRRCAAKGCSAVAFSENPPKLGLPPMYTGECYRVLRGNSINAYGLHRFGIHE